MDRPLAPPALTRFVVAVLLGLLANAAPCLAADPSAAPATSGSEAARLFIDGQRAFEAGDYRRAAAAFEAAYAKKPHHAPLWNAARSWHRAGDDLRAANLLERYLALAPADVADRVPATAALVEIKAHVGRVQVRAPAAMSTQLDGVAVEPGVIYVAPGEHVVLGQAGSKVVRHPFSIGSGEVKSVVLEIPTSPSPVPATEETRPKGTHVLPTWSVAIGAGLVLGSGALVTWWGLDTLDKRDAFLANRTQEGLDAAAATELRTNIFIATTAVLGLATTALAVFFVDWHPRSTRSR